MSEYHGFSRRGGVVIDTGPFGIGVPDHPPPFRYALENFWDIVVPAIRALELGATDAEMWSAGTYDLEQTLDLARSFGCKCWKKGGKCDALKARGRAGSKGSGKSGKSGKSGNPQNPVNPEPRARAVNRAGWEAPRIPKSVTARR